MWDLNPDSDNLNNSQRYNNIQINKTNNHNQGSSNMNNSKYLCYYSDCYKEYKTKYNLRRHILSHHGEVFYKCWYEGCDKRYKIKENLDLHNKNFHIKEKPFKCEYCQKNFSHRNGKLFHEKKKHLNILKCKCDRDLCKASYASRSALKYHLNNQHDK